MIKLLFISGLCSAFLCSAEAKESVFLAPHRAIYDLQLDDISNGTTILGMSGRMVYEFTGSACQGYTTRFRFVNRLYLENMPTRLTDQQITSYETGDGREFRFSVIEKIGQSLSNDVRGAAERTEDGIIVELKKPKKGVYKLAMADFPIMHLKAIIRQAKASRYFYYGAIFDGTNNANKVRTESVVIGEKKISTSHAETENLRKLDGKSYWPVTVSYFDDENNKGGLPGYRTSFLLYENGVMRDLRINYGNFSVRSKLENFELFDAVKDLGNCEH
ncbi:hypothetical protein BAnh1_05400 [Bartonella australis AUST/NH1]|uniref:ATP-binding protein n=1 Tax=Bartonella australis (strain Aust/NH1) TaxID=1094489 RepID=M1N3C8_BARAA|nr:cell envelope integrity EipB family protein [Bartonella australis]AGF74419.1 hypothetical protein BAnh1_05400 [Bartonella australis AUST/NH1]